MQRLLLLGDEALAQGAIDAGLSGMYAYPGTPSTEIMEYIQHSKDAKERKIHTDWSANEKTAMETALGMSYAGKRTMVAMKHVGLNVAADAFVNSSITGANGGIIVVVADDPSMHSSQNEQDSRFYGNFSMMPILEPSNQQEAYDMIHYGFEMSESFGTPVLLRITTRLAHSRADVVRREQRTQNEIKLPEDLKQFILLPSIARKRYKLLLEKQNDFIKASEESKFNRYHEGEDKSMGIIVSGIAYNYLMENYPDQKVPYPVLHINQYPIPEKYIQKMNEEVDSFLLLEEGYPFIEEKLKSILAKELIVKGRLDGTVPRDGELSPNIVAKALGMEVTYGEHIPNFVAGRPPELCKGCPHTDSYTALNSVLEDYEMGRVFADIGCYTLAALPPLEAIHTTVDMGASITMAKGAADAGLFPSVAVIGDSTFTHSGMTGLLDAVMENSNIVVMILDNSTTGMTGGQTSSAFGRIEGICEGIGVDKDHIRIINPLKKFHEQNVEVLREEIEYNGVSVIIPRRECVQTLMRKMKVKRAQRKKDKEAEK